MARKYRLTTLGCKVNQYESQQIRELFESLGLRPAREDEVADIAVVNTCAVTARASGKSRQALRRQRFDGVVSDTRTVVVAVGCAVSDNAERLRELSGVTAAFGHDTDVCAELRKLVTQIADGASETVAPAPTVRDQPGSGRTDHQFAECGRRNCECEKTTSRSSLHIPHSTFRIQLSPSAQQIVPPSHPGVKVIGPLTTKIDAFAGRQRAFLKVQDGCDASCTYCIIPRLRPTVRSKPLQAVVAEAQGLVRAGHKEIILTGIFLGAFGRSTAIRRRFADAGSPLANLVDALARVDGLRRLRLSSLEPGDVDDALLDVLVRHENCVPHFHLPLQSGDAEILRRMNRQYTRDAYLKMVRRIQSVLDHPAITTDVIVGFPGETDAAFEATLEIARQVEFAKIHAFPFSPREGTAAARWKKEFVHPALVRERMQRLADVERACSMSFRRRFIGRVERVLVEKSRAPRNATMDSTEPDQVSRTPVPIRHGRADRYFEVHFPATGVSAGVSAGDLVAVRIDRITPTRTHGTCV